MLPAAGAVMLMVGAAAVCGSTATTEIAGAVTAMVPTPGAVRTTARVCVLAVSVAGMVAEKESDEERHALATGANVWFTFTPSTSTFTLVLPGNTGVLLQVMIIAADVLRTTMPPAAGATRRQIGRGGGSSVKLPLRASKLRVGSSRRSVADAGNVTDDGTRGSRMLVMFASRATVPPSTATTTPPTTKLICSASVALAEPCR